MLAKLRQYKPHIYTIILAGVLLRVGLISLTDGGVDLRLYAYFSNLAAHGADPYNSMKLPTEFQPFPSDNPPFHLLFFAGILKVYNSQLIIRFVFVVCEAAMLVTVFKYSTRSQLWKQRFITFYALNPLILLWWTGFSEDKTIIFFTIVIVIIGLERNRLVTSWAGTTFLACFKWMGGFFLPSLVVETIRNKGVKSTSYLFVGSLLCLSVVNIPWFPKNLVVFQRRSNRMNFDPPMHLSITRLLSEIGLYDPLIPKVGIPLILVVIFGLHLKEKIDMREVVVLSTLASYLLLPDEGHNRILMITLPFLLIIPAESWKRWRTWWVVSSIQAGLVYNTFAQTDHRASLPALNHLFGGPNSIGELLIGNAFLITVLASYLKTRFSPEWMQSRITEHV